MPFGGGCGYKYQLCKIYCVIYLEIFSILQSKQCLRRLNLTFKLATHFCFCRSGKAARLRVCDIEADDFVQFSALGAERGLQKRFRHAAAQPERCNQLSAESVAKQ